MDLGLNDKTALVLGASGGLGGAVARALAQEGATVIAAGRNEQGLEATCKAITEAGGHAIAQPWDLAQRDRFQGWLEQAMMQAGPIDILFNNTGGPPPSPAQGIQPDAWERFFNELVVSVIHLTDLVLPAMKQAGWGRIITSTSSGVVTPIPNLGLSNALRSSLLGWSKTLARELGPAGITANILVPGRIATGRVVTLDEAKAKREQRDYDSVVQESMATIPLQRYGKPEEYGATAAFLASQQASYITGAIIRVDGGLIASI